MNERKIERAAITIGVLAASAACGQAVVGDDGVPTSGAPVVVHAPNELWVAAKDDAHGWRRLTGNGDRFELDPGASGRYAVAVRAPSSTLFVLWATRDELPEVVVGAAADVAQFQLRGSIAGAEPGSVVRVTARDNEVVLPDVREGTTFDLDVPGGALDLIGLEFVQNEPRAIRILRDLDIGGATQGLPQIDFGQASIVPVEQRTPLIGAQGATMTFLTAHGALPLELGPLDGGDLRWLRLPSGALESDAYRLVAEGSGVRVTRVFRAVPNETLDSLDLGTIAPFGGTVEASQPVRLAGLRYESEGLPAILFGATLEQAGHDGLSISVSTGWLAGASSFEVDLPSGLDGFQSYWGVSSGSLHYRAFALASNGPLPQLLGPQRTIGLQTIQRDHEGSF